MKYAVVESGGKQYIAREGETIEVDRLPLDIGKSITFDKVLLVVDGKDVSVGAPSVQGAKVKGTVIDQVKARKVIVFKYIPKERYRRKRGHRQHYTQVAIEDIAVSKPRKKAAKDEDAAAVKKAESSTKIAAEKSEPKKADAKAKPKKADAKAKPKKADAKAKPKKADAKAKPKKAETKGKTAASKSKAKDAKAESKTKRTSSKTKKADKK